MLFSKLMLSRRQFTTLASAGLATLLAGSPAQAGLARAVPLAELLKRSQRVVLGLPLDAFSRWETLGGRRRIVTYTQLQVEHDLDEKRGDVEYLVRTLGGRVGDIGQVVHGEARLERRQHGVVFLRPDDAGILHVTELAQGHYPLRAGASGVPRLYPDSQLGELVNADQSAAKRLVGRTLSEAVEALREAKRK